MGVTVGNMIEPFVNKEFHMISASTGPRGIEPSLRVSFVESPI